MCGPDSAIDLSINLLQHRVCFIYSMFSCVLRKRQIFDYKDQPVYFLKSYEVGDISYIDFEFLALLGWTLYFLNLLHCFGGFSTSIYVFVPWLYFLV